MGPIDGDDLERVAARRAAVNELEMLADLDSAVSWLQARPEVTSEQIAVIGFSMGGTFALNLAARREDLATCIFYGFPRGSPEPAITAPAPLDVVDELSGPLIGFWGESDTAVGMDSVQRLVEALAERGVEFHCLTYPGVGHGFMAEERPDDRTVDAARHAWARVTAFLRRHVVDVEPSGL
jgi:carboxymethylenebutenolidase